LFDLVFELSVVLVVSVLDDKLGDVSIVDSNFSTISNIGESFPNVEITLIVLSGETGSRIELFDVFLEVGSLRSNFFTFEDMFSIIFLG